MLLIFLENFHFGMSWKLYNSFWKLKLIETFYFERDSLYATSIKTVQIFLIIHQNASVTLRVPIIKLNFDFII